MDPLVPDTTLFRSEADWNVSDDGKITAGARYTNDKKTSTPIPSQLLLGAENFGNTSGASSGGRVSRGYPALPPIEQQWDAFTGRLVVDWKPETSFSDEDRKSTRLNSSH